MAITSDPNCKFFLVRKLIVIGFVDCVALRIIIVTMEMNTLSQRVNRDNLTTILVLHDRLGVQPGVHQWADGAEPPSSPSRWRTHPHVWSSTHDPVCLQPQPGQSGSFPKQALRLLRGGRPKHYHTTLLTPGRAARVPKKLSFTFIIVFPNTCVFWYATILLAIAIVPVLE